MDEAARTFDELVGLHIRALRREPVWVNDKPEVMTQEQLARAVSKNGLNWRRATVVQVESGKRALSLAEALALSEIFSKPLDYFVRTSDECPVRIGDATWSSRYVELVVAGVGHLYNRSEGPPITSPLRTAEARERPDWQALLRTAATWEVKWPGDLDHPYETNQVEVAAAERIENKTRLGVTPDDVAAAAWRSWQTTVAEESERRVRQRADSGAGPRTLQALRGHVMREIDRELRVEIEEAADRAERAAKPGHVDQQADQGADRTRIEETGV